MFKKRTRVPKETLVPGHLYWTNNDTVIDLGSVSLEDLKLAAYVAQEAKVNLVSRKHTASRRTLSRVDQLLRRMYTLANRS